MPYGTKWAVWSGPGRTAVEPSTHTPHYDGCSRRSLISLGTFVGSLADKNDEDHEKGYLWVRIDLDFRLEIDRLQAVVSKHPSACE
jgi:hypothetical protein